jgi:hypothetical protein
VGIIWRLALIYMLLRKARQCTYCDLLRDSPSAPRPIRIGRRLISPLLQSSNMLQKNLFDVPELHHFKLDQLDDINPVLPNQHPTATRQVTELPVGIDQPNFPSYTIKLAVDAFPGCGGIAWPAGCVSTFSLPTLYVLAQTS